MSPEPEEITNATTIPNPLKTRAIDCGLSKHGIPYVKLKKKEMIKNQTKLNGMGQTVATLTILLTKTLVHFVCEYIISVLTWMDAMSNVKAGSTKTVFSVDMYIL